MPLLRDDQWLVHFDVPNVSIPYVPSGWSSFEGGDVTANNVKVFPGGMYPQVDLGGVPTRSDITIKRPYSTALHAILVQLENVTGGADCSCSTTPKDANGNPTGGTITYTGKVKTVTRPNYEAGSTGQGSYLQVTMSANLKASLSQ